MWGHAVLAHPAARSLPRQVRTVLEVVLEDFRSRSRAMDRSAPMLANFEALPKILTAQEPEKFLRINRKTIYSYVQCGLISHMRIESNARFSKHQVQRWLEEHSLQPRPVNGKGAKRQ
jgi:hypothetical protein